MRIFSAIVLMSCALAQAAETVTLQQALSAAASRYKREDARSSQVHSYLSYLESQRKMKIELRPQMALLAFSNPVLLATSIGSSLLMSKSQAPAPYAWRSAQFDALDAELGRERRRLETEMETVRRFFHLLDRQQSADACRKVIESRRAGRAQMERLLAAGKLTAVERASFETGLVELEMQYLETETARELAAVELGQITGWTGPGKQLRAAEAGTANALWTTEIPSQEALLVLALGRRGETRLFREKIEEQRREASGVRRVRFDNFSPGYAHVAGGKGQSAGTGAGGYLLGGHTARVDLGVAVTLRKTGEKEATEELIAARIRALEVELDAMEDAIRWEVDSIRRLTDSSRKMLALAEKKLELAQSAEQSVAVRLDNGLTAPDAAILAELEVLRAQSNHSQALYESRARAFHLMTVCGVDPLAETQAASGGTAAGH